MQHVGLSKMHAFCCVSSPCGPGGKGGCHVCRLRGVVWRMITRRHWLRRPGRLRGDGFLRAQGARSCAWECVDSVHYNGAEVLLMKLCTRPNRPTSRYPCSCARGRGRCLSGVLHYCRPVPASRALSTVRVYVRAAHALCLGCVTTPWCGCVEVWM